MALDKIIYTQTTKEEHATDNIILHYICRVPTKRIRPHFICISLLNTYFKNQQPMCSTSVRTQWKLGERWLNVAHRNAATGWWRWWGEIHGGVSLAKAKTSNSRYVWELWNIYFIFRSITKDVHSLCSKSLTVNIGIKCMYRNVIGA